MSVTKSKFPSYVCFDLPTDSQLENRPESSNNTGLLVGVSVAVCCLLVAAGVMVRRHFLSKKIHSSSVSSLVSESSTSDLQNADVTSKTAWMPIIADDKFKASKRPLDRI